MWQVGGLFLALGLGLGLGLWLGCERYNNNKSWLKTKKKRTMRISECDVQFEFQSAMFNLNQSAMFNLNQSAIFNLNQQFESAIVLTN